MNYSELRRMLERLIEAYEKSEFTFEDYKKNILEVNRVIINLLSSIRMFIDHNETRLKRKKDSISNSYDEFKTELSGIYDNSFSYRFLNKFRNYTQHCGLATNSMNIKQSYEEPGKVKCNISVLLNRDKLLLSFDWGNFTVELQKQNETIDVIPMIDEVMALLSTINEKVIKNLYSNHTQLGNELVFLLNQASNIPGAPCIIKGSPGGVLVNYVPLDLVEKIPGVTINLPLRKVMPDVSKHPNLQPDWTYYTSE